MRPGFEPRKPPFDGVPPVTHSPISLLLIIAPCLTITDYNSKSQFKYNHKINRKVVSKVAEWSKSLRMVRPRQ